MKKISKLVGLTLAALAIMLTGCRKSTGSSTPIDRDEIPADAVRLYGEGSKLTELSVYGVEDLEKLAELVNEGDDFEGMTVTVKKDIVINENVLTKAFEEPEEGEEGTPNPKFKNLESIGRGKSATENYDASVFKGIFDGNGKVISGLYMYQGHQGLGLFGRADGAVIKNVILVDACVINRNYVPNPDPEASYPHDNKDDDRFGGLVGLVEEGAKGVTIENCLFAGVVGSQAALDRGTPYEYIGSLIGRTYAASTIKDSFVFARVYGSHEDLVVGKGLANVTIENVESIDASASDEDLTAQIEEAIEAVKANLQ